MGHAQVRLNRPPWTETLDSFGPFPYLPTEDLVLGIFPAAMSLTLPSGGVQLTRKRIQRGLLREGARLWVQGHGGRQLSRGAGGRQNEDCSSSVPGLGPGLRTGDRAPDSQTLPPYKTRATSRPPSIQRLSKSSGPHGQLSNFSS